MRGRHRRDSDLTRFCREQRDRIRHRQFTRRSSTAARRSSGETHLELEVRGLPQGMDGTYLEPAAVVVRKR